MPDSSNRRQLPIWSASSSESPTPWPWAARKVKHIPPPTSSESTCGSSDSITCSLSDTFDPPSTTAYGRSGSWVSLRSTSTSVSTSPPAYAGSSRARS